jgi:orotidine-5'-phosphate decarboxylase
MSKYIDLLENVHAKKNTMLCFGMDPVLERMKIDNSKNLADEIVTYFTRIFDAVSGKISAVKPNVAFYLQYGMDGLSALVELIKKVKSAGMPVIIDAKLGDIGRTAAAYSKYIFEFLQGDSVTLSPYLGYDSLEPFFKYHDRGFYLLALTSNRGAGDFQLGRIETGARLYEHVLGVICSWSEEVRSAGAVIGATQNEFRGCIELLNDRSCSVPLLVPGVGAQGGSYGNIRSILEELEYNQGIVRINASSAISYAHEKFESLAVEEASFRAVEELLG